MTEANADIQQAPQTVTATAVTPAEMELAFGNPAPISNRVLLTMMPMGGRLSFMELGPDGTPYFRAAVYMGLDGLQSLQVLIGNMLESLQTAPPQENPDVPQR
jgi:hypothetical protein